MCLKISLTCSKQSYQHRLHDVQGIFKVPVTEDQLSLILKTLQYEGILEPAPSSEEEETWQVAKYKLPVQTPFTSFPCGVCPV